MIEDYHDIFNLDLVGEDSQLDYDRDEGGTSLAELGLVATGNETEKAIQFRGYDAAIYWIPKSQIRTRHDGVQWISDWLIAKKLITKRY